MGLPTAPRIFQMEMLTQADYGRHVARASKPDFMRFAVLIERELPRLSGPAKKAVQIMRKNSNHNALVTPDWCDRIHELSLTIAYHLNDGNAEPLAATRKLAPEDMRP